jgi:hypothetical protein
VTHSRFGPSEYLRRRNLPPGEREPYLAMRNNGALDERSVDDIVRDLVKGRGDDDPPECIFLQGDD